VPASASAQASDPAPAEAASGLPGVSPVATTG